MFVVCDGRGFAIAGERTALPRLAADAMAKPTYAAEVAIRYDQAPWPASPRRVERYIIRCLRLRTCPCSLRELATDASPM